MPQRLRESTSGANRWLEPFLRGLNKTLGIEGAQWDNAEAGGASTRFNRAADGSLRAWTGGGVFDATDHGKSAFELFDKLSQNAGGGPDTNVVTGDLTSTFTGGTSTHNFGTNRNLQWQGLGTFSLSANTMRQQSDDFIIEPQTPTQPALVQLRDGDNAGGYNNVTIQSAADNLQAWTFTLPNASPVTGNSIMRFDDAGNADFVTLGVNFVGTGAGLSPGFNATSGALQLRSLQSVSSSVSIAQQPDGSLSFDLNVDLGGRYRGTITLADGSSQAWPTIAQGTRLVNDPFQDGDKFFINMPTVDDTATFTDGTTPQTVKDNAYAILEDATDPTNSASWRVVQTEGTTTDTNIVTSSLTKTDTGDLVHAFNGVNLTFDNVDNFTVNGNTFGASVAAGSALAIDAVRTVNLGGYAGGAKNGVPTIAMGMNAAGDVVTFEAPPIGWIKHAIELTTDIAAGSNIDISGAAADTNAVNDGGLIFNTAPLNGTAALAADPHIRIDVDGEAATFETLYSSPKLQFTLTAPQLFSCNQDLPMGTIIEFVVPRYS